MGEQQTLHPAVTELKQQLVKLNIEKITEGHTIKFCANSGVNREAKSEFDIYIADNQFKKRNPPFKASETYETEQKKQRLKRSKGKPKLFSSLVSFPIPHYRTVPTLFCV